MDYSVYVMRQASRRSWRIGQTRPVKVVFMAYRGTLQADALKLVAKKLWSSLAVDRELPEDGLAAYGDDGDEKGSLGPLPSMGLSSKLLLQCEGPGSSSRSRTELTTTRCACSLRPSRPA